MASARSQSRTGSSEPTSLPRGYAGRSVVLITSISPSHRRSPDHALASFWCEIGGEGLGTASLCASSRSLTGFAPHRVAIFLAMVLRLEQITPHPTHLSKPSSPLSRHRPRNPRRLDTLMRPSIPALKRIPCRNHPCLSCSRRCWLFLPGLGRHTRSMPRFRHSPSFSGEYTPRSAATSLGGLP